ncbi:MAG: tetratricopeptide repeat protein [Bacteroidetes bacterium]|nr:tetratricopeptide repeat protein [Bacteroidota bacterium]
MKKPQWITLLAGLVITGALFLFGRTVPEKKPVSPVAHSADDGHNHSPGIQAFSVDTMLMVARKRLSAQQVSRINLLENSITRGDLKDQQLHVFHQLARFWGDSARIFEPYAWYTAEAARLENSEKSLTFAAQLFLDNLQSEETDAVRQWKALQAKDLFERSLKINPGNDSAQVGLGACYLFGGISEMPMEGIQKIRKVVEKDSTNIYAQMTLVRGLLISGQYEKAINRLQTVNKLNPAYPDALLLLAEVYDQTGDKQNATLNYEKCLQLELAPEVKKAIQERITLLKK